MARSGQRREPEYKRERLIAAASSLFGQYGYHRTSTRQISTLAGVSEGMLFHQFGSKQDLFAEIAKQFADRAVQEIVPEKVDDYSSEVVIRRAFSLADREPILNVVFVEDESTLEEFGALYVREQMIDASAKLLARGMREGKVRLTDARILAELQYSLVQGAYKAWRRSGDPEKRETFITECIYCMNTMEQPSI